jgi:ribosomal protein S12 methylthiotransferase accessory factor
LTLLSGARDDLSSDRYDGGDALFDASLPDGSDGGARVDFRDTPDHSYPSFDADLNFELERLTQAGLEQVIAVNLTQPDLGVPVVRVVIPYLETMSELPGYVPGVRARRALSEAVP